MTKIGLSQIISLAAYRRRRRREDIVDRASDLGRSSAQVVLLFPGILLTITFGALRIAGVIDWSAIWILLPLLIDVALWFSVFRYHALIRLKAQYDDDDDDDGDDGGDGGGLSS